MLLQCLYNDFTNRARVYKVSTHVECVTVTRLTDRYT